MSSKKVIGIFGLVCCLPVLFVIPGISQYPLTAAGGILATIALLQYPGDVSNEGYKDTNAIEICQINHVGTRLIQENDQNDRDRARPVSC